MVKGVNKTVIEISDTGSKMFDKIVFYVSPSYCQTSAKRLQNAAKDFAFKFDGMTGAYLPLRAKKRRIRWGRAILLAGIPLVLSGLVLMIILLKK